MADTMTATIHEVGNGWVAPGDYVAGDDELYRVVSLDGPIHTGQPGESSYVYATVESADWDDVPEGWESRCSATLETDEDDAE